MNSGFYDLSATLNDGHEKPFSAYRGKVLLIANTASGCGFTPQYKGLQALYERYRAQGFEVLAFPCDQFGRQEPGSDAEIIKFCEVNFGVSFSVFKKVQVNGSGAHPVFVFLKAAAPAWFGRPVKWNFTKFLVNRDGLPVKRFAPFTPPEKIERHIQNLLAS